jgi:hypothetical protein
VQVKSTDVPRGDGRYIRYLKRTGIHYYRIEDVDFLRVGEGSVVHPAVASGAATKEQYPGGAGVEEAEVCAV